MSANDLLLWLSARQEGSWQQFRAAVEELHLQGEEADDKDPDAGARLPVHQQLRFSLERLGHVEFSRHEDQRWRVVPPAVGFLPTEDQAAAVVCGARSPQTVGRLRTLADTQVNVSAAEGVPDRIVLRSASEADLADGVRHLGFLVQRSAAMTLLASLPSVRECESWSASDFPTTPGWTIHRFSRSQMRWTDVDLNAATRGRARGLFRFSMKHQRFYYVVNDGQSSRVPVQVGKYAVLAGRRGVLRYDCRSRTVSVRPICRPPLLVERALILCSGCLPKVNDAGWLEYPIVPRELARLAADVLCQELE